MPGLPNFAYGRRGFRWQKPSGGAIGKIVDSRRGRFSICNKLFCDWTRRVALKVESSFGSSVDQESIVLGIKKILLATDLGTNSERATEYARLFTAQFDAELHVLHVLEDMLSNTPAFGGGLALNSYVHESPANAERKMRDLFEPSWLIGKRVVTSSVDGEPGEQILRYAKVHSIDLIVLGTHGRTGLAHILVGSVAERVTQHSLCAVMVARRRT